MNSAPLKHLVGLFCLVSLAASATAANFNLTNINDLVNLSSTPTTGDTAVVSGYYTASDGGGGNFTFTASTETANNGTVVRPASISSGSPGRWIRTLPTTGIDVRMFGARQGSNQTDSVRQINKDSIQLAIDEVVAKGYSTLRFSGGRYEIGFKPIDLYDSSRPARSGYYNGLSVANAWDGWVDFSFLLHLGDQATAAGRNIEFVGDGATIYTEEENCNATMLLLDASFAEFKASRLHFERKVTTKFYPRTPTAPTNPTALGFGPGFTSAGLNRSAVMIYPVANQQPCKIKFANSDFVDCHFAAVAGSLESRSEFANRTGALWEERAGKLEELVFESCPFSLSAWREFFFGIDGQWPGFVDFRLREGPDCQRLHL